MGVAFASDNFLPPRNWKNRLPVAALVVFLHLIFLAVLRFQNVTPPVIPHTDIITVPLMPKKKETVPAPQAAGTAARESRGTVKPLRDFPKNAPDLSNMFFLMNTCSIGNLALPSQEDRNRCRAATGFAVGKVQDDFSMASKARHAAQYAAEVAEKQAPFRLPCAYTSGTPGASSPAMMFDVFCTVGKITDTVDRIRRGDY